MLKNAIIILTTLAATALTACDDEPPSGYCEAHPNNSSVCGK